MAQCPVRVARRYDRKLWIVKHVTKGRNEPAPDRVDEQSSLGEIAKRCAAR